MKKGLLPLILLLTLSFSGVRAQTTASYFFSSFSSTYSSISTTGTTMGGGWWGDDNTQLSVPLGFTFSFCGTAYTQTSICTNGWISLTNSTSIVWGNAAAAIPSNGFLFAYWDDLVSHSPSSYYQTTGTAPNRIFTMEWGEMTLYPNFGTTPAAGFQMKLYETSNVIDFLYGTSAWSSSSASIGIANGAGDYRTVDGIGATPSASTTFYTHSGSPATNQVYRWSPCPVTVNATPSAAVCPGGSVTLTGTTTGTSWSWTGPGGYTSTAISPVINPTATGTYVLVASNGTCTMSASAIVTVNPLPAVPTITPSVTTVCNGASTSLTSSASATWTPTTYLFSDAGLTTPYTGAATTTVYVYPTTVTVVTPITYTATVTNGFGCTRSSTATVTINPATAAITGPGTVCAGYNITLSSTTSGGTWSSSATGVGTVNSTTGVVTGITPGTTTIFYTVAGCSSIAVVTVTPTPTAITGINIACLGATTTLTSTPAGGTWSSSNPSIGTVNATTGVVGGITVGTTTITYDLGSGCFVTRTVSVNPYPSAISGPGSVCLGACSMFSSTPTTGGLWTSSAPAVATVVAAGATAGNVCGVALGTSTIRYQVAGCAVTTVVTVVNSSTPPTGPNPICAGSTGSYTTSTTGGTWSSSTASVGTIDAATGVLTGITSGTTTITYALSAGCISTLVVTVTAAPAAITGSSTVCLGLTTPMSHPVTGGAWSSSTPAVGTIGAGTGLAGGVSTGTTTITYLLPTPAGCYTTKSLTVNALPSAITGTLSLCVGESATLSSATPGGTWSSSATGTATISSGGTWTAGTTTGTATITYTAPTGCITTATVTVNGLPSAITGAGTVCEFQTITLSSATSGGVWSSSTPAVGTISGSGVLYGVSGGTTTITYAMPSGCYVTAVRTVNPAPAALTGSLGLCVGGNTTLSSTTTGGTWSSSAPAIGTILAPGFIGGVSAGTANISYIIGATGCWAVATVTVNAAPGAIGGGLNVCVGSTSALTSTGSGGTWTSSNPAAGTIDATTGVFYGVAPGSSTVVYSLGSGCTVTATVTVNALPSAISGTLALCQGVCSTLGSTPSGGSWLSDNLSVATIGATTGNLCGVSAGTANITYTASGTGCRRYAIATVNTVPAAITGPTSMCAGQCNSYTSGAGGAWSSSNPAVGTISAAGTFCGISAGTTNITYLMPTGCYRTLTVLVNGLPAGMSPAAPQVCVGSTQTMTGSPGGGTWSSSTPSIGTISTGGGALGGISAGTTTLTYTNATGCYITQTATVNGLPGAIGGVLSTCVGQTTTLSATPAGGTWSSSAGTGTGTIGSTSGVLVGGTAGTVSVTYTLGTGCRTTSTVTVFALPGAITGVPQVCEMGGTTTLTGTPSGGTWSSSATGIAMVSGTGPGTATVTGVSATATPPGTATITYTLGTGCISTRDVWVNPLPSPISGSLTTCVGQTTTLSNPTPSGAWAINPVTVATVSGTGVVMGVSGGSGSATALVSYTLPTGCRTTAIVTVYALPSAISPSPTTVCENGTTALSTTTPGGTWSSSNPAAGTVNTTTGLLYGIAAGTTNITYTLGTGCYSAAVATVNAVPAPISGVLQVCQGQTTALSDATPSGAWSSSAPGTAAVSTGGVVTGGTPGTATISYTLPTGCAATATVTVHSLPGTITGPSPMWVCENSTITLSCTPGGGIWSSGSANVAVNPVSGDVTGVTAGTATITYTQGIGCVRTATVTVQAQPAVITGNLNVCIGQTQTLSTASTTGTWSSSNTAVAPVTSGGVVSGAALGTANISYTLPVTGCARSVQVTVQPLPGPITGPAAFCNFSNTTYSNSSPGGIWSSADTSIISIIDSVTGVVYGQSVDTTDIIYTLPTGCSTSKSVFLILAPYPITGPHDMCYGQTRTLSNAISGGVWSSSNASIASVNPSTGVVTGVNYGTATITYVLSTGCFSTYDVTVNPIPSAIAGPLQVCEGDVRIYSNAFSGGTWTSGDTSLAIIDTFSGALTALMGGTMQITYTLGTGCNAMKDLTINSLPAVISGPTQVCEGSTVSEVSGPSGGIWSASTGNLFIDATTGDVTGIFTGTSTISYTLPTGCFRKQDMTVNPLPAIIVGPTDICVGDQTLLTCGTPGGTWVSSLPSIGTIGATTGIFGGVSGGTTVVSYVLSGTSCMSTHPMTVNNNPAPITGMTTVCAGFATNLYSGPSGGVWSQAPGSLTYGNINAVTGVVSGITAGFIPVTYSLGSGCRAVDTVEVINLPAVIGGSPTVCVNDTTILTSPVSGGVWSSSNAARATVDAMSGAVVGVSPGTVVITYFVSTGCFNVLTVSVNPLPAPITGAMQVCEQSTTILGSTTPGGLWISGNTAVGTVSPAGPSTSTVFTGISAGTVNITYMLFTGCKSIAQMTVNSTPAPITGNPHICMGASNTFTTTSTGGVWSTSNPSIATINPASGVATSVSLGVVTISYTYPGTGCTSTRVVTVQPLPNVYNVSGGGNYCAGGTGLAVNLSGSQPGVSYELYYGSSATGFLAGTGFPLNFGLHTPGGVYTVQATNVTSGCKRNMAGSATIVVNPLVTPAVTIATTPNDSVCTGETVAMTANPTWGGTAPTYAWKVNGVFVSTAGNYSYIPADGDVVTVTMTSNYSCLATATATGTQLLTVMPMAAPVAGVISTPGDTVCQHNPVTFTAAPVYGGSAPAYTWLVNGSTAAYGPTFTYVPVNGDIVNLRMTSDYRCRIVDTLTGGDTVTSGDVTMSVDSLKLPKVTVTVEPGMIVAAGKPATLHAWAEDAGPNPTYQWKVNGVLVPGATSQTYTAIFGDYDSISVTVVSSGVCHNIGTVDWFFIGVAPLSTTQSAATISDLRLVPNPNKGTFTISGNLSSGSDEDVNVDVTDMLGQVVFRGVVKAKAGRIESRITLENNLANGMYLLTLRAGAEQKVFHFVMEQ